MITIKYAPSSLFYAQNPRDDRFFMGSYQSPIGDIVLVSTINKECFGLYLANQSVHFARAQAQIDFPTLTFHENDQLIRELGDALFSQEQESTLLLIGTPFQIDVWRALTNLKKGETVSYKELARAVGRPESHRAVANAVGSNRITYIIPCHRVIRTDGTLGGYRWGIEKKQEFLDQEQED